MGVKLHHVPSTNLVLVGLDLIATHDETEQFTKSADLDLRIDLGHAINIASGETEQSRKLTSELDRIVLEISPSRTTITRQYPSRNDLARLSQVIATAISCTNLQCRTPRAFGYNIEMTFEQDSGETALAYLGNRLFRSQPPGNPDWHFVGATARSVFEDVSGQWTIAAEPRANDSTEARVFLNLNFHKTESRLPGEDEINDSLNRIWDEGLAFMNRLDQRSAS